MTTETRTAIGPDHIILHAVLGAFNEAILKLGGDPTKDGTQALQNWMKILSPRHQSTVKRNWRLHTLSQVTSTVTPPSIPAQAAPKVEPPPTPVPAVAEASPEEEGCFDAFVNSCENPTQELPPPPVPQRSTPVETIKAELEALCTAYVKRGEIDFYYQPLRTSPGHVAVITSSYLSKDHIFNVTGMVQKTPFQDATREQAPYSGGKGIRFTRDFYDVPFRLSDQLDVKKGYGTRETMRFNEVSVFVYVINRDLVGRFWMTAGRSRTQIADRGKIIF